jgi:hypothetical protein
MRIDSGDSESISGRHAKQRRRQERLEGRIRKCVAGCGLMRRNIPTSQSEQLPRLQREHTRSNSKMHLFGTLSKPQISWSHLPLIPIINQATPPAPVQSELSLFPPSRHGKPLYVVTTSLSPTTFHLPNPISRSLHTTTPQNPQSTVKTLWRVDYSFNWASIKNPTIKVIYWERER